MLIDFQKADLWCCDFPGVHGDGLKWTHVHTWADHVRHDACVRRLAWQPVPTPLVFFFIILHLSFKLLLLLFFNCVLQCQLICLFVWVFVLIAVVCLFFFSLRFSFLNSLSHTLTLLHKFPPSCLFGISEKLIELFLSFKFSSSLVG